MEFNTKFTMPSQITSVISNISLTSLQMRKRVYFRGKEEKSLVDHSNLLSCSDILYIHAINVLVIYNAANNGHCIIRRVYQKTLERDLADILDGRKYDSHIPRKLRRHLTGYFSKRGHWNYANRKTQKHDTLFLNFRFHHIYSTLHTVAKNFFFFFIFLFLK